MGISVIIPYFNDLEIFNFTLPFIISSLDGYHSEIIIIDNGSHDELYIPEHPNVRVIRNQVNVGVGGAFNQGVEESKYDNIVIMGPDVVPKGEWVDRVLDGLENTINTMFSCTSTSFDPGFESGLFMVGTKRRYGANILFKMDRDDLPDEHPDRIFPNYHRILQTKWNEDIPSGDTRAVECMLGAFYWMHKSDFVKVRGFNGHKNWGSLEPFISIKARAHGMRILVDHKIEAAHDFGRKVTRGSRADIQYYNMLFMAHTMFSEALRDELVDYLLCGDGDKDLGRLNVKQGLKMLKRHTGLVKAERDYNNRHFKHGLISNWDNFNTQMI